MITEPTVLILGAGAAVDYGFPLGRKLRDLVCGTTRGGFSREIVDAGYDRKELEEFESTLRLVSTPRPTFSATCDRVPNRAGAISRSSFVR